jgi:uncharacterized protein (TIGR03000 family)
MAWLPAQVQAQLPCAVARVPVCNVRGYAFPGTSSCLPNPVATFYSPRAIANSYSVGMMPGCNPGWLTGGYPVLGVPVLELGRPCGSGSVAGLKSSIYGGSGFYFGSDPLLNAGIFSTNNNVPPAAPDPAPTATAAAEVDLVVPADAELWVQDVRMQQQTGAVRLFVSPALPVGRDFRYRVRATYQDRGRAMTATRMLTVRAGERLKVDLLTLPAVADPGSTAQR